MFLVLQKMFSRFDVVLAAKQVSWEKAGIGDFFSLNGYFVSFSVLFAFPTFESTA